MVVAKIAGISKLESAYWWSENVGNSSSLSGGRVFELWAGVYMWLQCWGAYNLLPNKIRLCTALDSTMNTNFGTQTFSKVRLIIRSPYLDCWFCVILCDCLRSAWWKLSSVARCKIERTNVCRRTIISTDKHRIVISQICNIWTSEKKRKWKRRNQITQTYLM